MSQSYTIRPLEESMRAETVTLLTDAWGGTRMASLGRIVDAATLPGLVAVRESKIVGLLTWHETAEGEAAGSRVCELLTLNAFLLRQGIGTALIAAFETWAAGQGFDRVFLITTNDNEPAQRLYEGRGWRLAEVRKGAVDEARRTIKPEIPLYGNGGVRISDELVYEWADVLGSSEGSKRGS